MNRREVDNIIRNSNEFEYIYFDCFDTLIKRKNSIKYDFIRLADMLIIEYGFPIKQEELTQSLFNIFTRCDVDFSELVNDVFLHYEKYLCSIKFEDFYETFMDTFIKSEMDNIQLEDNVELLIDSLKGKRLYLLSDYYLGRSIVEKFFVVLLGYNPFIDIIISCDKHASKQDGSLYKFVNNPEKSLMVGDNKIGDVFYAKNIGMQSVYINAYKNYEKYRIFDEKYNSIILNKLYKKRIRNSKNYTSNFVFSLFYFCKKLYSNLRKNDVVWFLARDGFFMKQCFDIFLEYGNNKNIQTRYLETSRLALLLPSLADDEFTASKFKEKFIQRTQWRIHSGRELLESLGIGIDEIDEFGILDKDVDDYFLSEEYCLLFNDKKFIEILKKHRSETKNKFNSLITESGNRFIIADSGWQGTSQNDMRKVIPNEKEIIGYYYGTTYCIGEVKNSHKEGIIFDYANVSDEALYYFYEIEGVLKSNKGQLISYSKNENLYTYDNGLKVFNTYSNRIQTIMLDVFKRLIVLNKVYPVSFSTMEVMMNKLLKRENIISMTWGHFYYNLQNGNVEKYVPDIADYLTAVKYKLKFKHPQIYWILKNLKHEYSIYHK